MRAIQNPDIFPFYTYGTCVKLRTFKIAYFQKYVLSKLRTFKILYFQKYVLLKIRTFCRIPCFFQNFRVFKNSPFKVHLEFPTKIPCFFKNSPFQKKKLILQIPCFFSKNSVFYKIPRFFKTHKKTYIFLYKKNVYLQLKNMYLQLKKHIFTK